MSTGFFVTGTDTGVGKTRFTISLMQALKNQDYKVVGMKPIAPGSKWIAGELINEDARLIMAHCSNPVAYELVNPFVFEPPIAPHIAAKRMQQTIELTQIISRFEQLKLNGEIIIVEGVGGWRVPISDDAFLVEIVRALHLPVIMVVGIKLGCINHALLTAAAIQSDGIALCGWVSSHLEKEGLYKQEVIHELATRLACPHIADLPYMEDFNPDKVTDKIKLSTILPVVA